MRFFAASLLSLVSIVACSATANVGSDVSPSSADADAGKEGSAPTDAAPTDVEGGAADVGCGISFPQEGSFVDAATILGPAPQYTGGTIVPGTYELVALRAYAAATGTMRIRETMVVRGSAESGALERIVEARDAVGSFQDIPLRGETATYEIGAAAILFVNPLCPQPRFLTGEFEASGTTLVIYDGPSAVEKTYRRLR